MTSIPQPTEADERSHLTFVTERIYNEATHFDSIVRRKRGEALEIKRYLNENKADMDHAEKISTRGTTDQATMLTDFVARRRQLLDKLVNSPYFGRIDFITDGQAVRKPYYIGIHSFADPESDTHLVHDWRAPVSSMFYHHETGPAGHDAPDGRVDGEVLLKRQFRIEHGEMESMLEECEKFFRCTLSDSRCVGTARETIGHRAVVPASRLPVHCKALRYWRRHRSLQGSVPSTSRIAMPRRWALGRSGE